MKQLITSFTVAALLTLPVTASGQNIAAPNATTPAAGNTMMSCPMMARMPTMQQNMGSMMAEMQAMAKDAQDPAMKDRMQKMHERMAAMMASMQQMGAMRGMMGNAMPGRAMMGAQQPGAADTKPDAVPSNGPASQ